MMLPYFLAFESPAVTETIIAQQTKENNSQENLIIDDLVGVGETRLVVQERGAEERVFELVAQDSASDNQESPRVGVENVSVVELNADRQEYDQIGQLITAEGDVFMRFKQAILTSDTVTIDLVRKVAIAEGNVTLTRGNQVLRGTRFEYFFAENSGVIFQASGEVDQATSDRDFDLNLASDVNRRNIRDPRTLQPLENVTGKDGLSFGTGSVGSDIISPDANAGGQINKIRFQADRIDFKGETWEAQNVRLTNDPFSPPELEIRANTATLNQSPTGASELRTTKSRVVFDQGLSLPIFQNRLVFDQRNRQPSLFQLGYDGTERGGLFVQGNFTILRNNNLDLSISPQYFLQESIKDGFSENVFGVKTNFDFDISPRTSLRSSASLTSFDFGKVEDNLRANARLKQLFGNLQRPYNLTLEYTYRDRLFSGSQGFQTVQSSLGGIFASPNFVLGNSGINLSYQLGIHQIEANTDRPDLLTVNRTNDRVDLTRYQGAIALSKGFTLWSGQPLPATKEEGLRYRRSPVTPYLTLNTGITGVASYYSNGDNQSSLSGNIGIQGQFGRFSRKFFDYTNFNLGFSQVLKNNESPFLFDRLTDTKTLSFGLTQQIYGPFLFGFQSYLNLDTGKEISTDYTLEYSRRTYNITLRYNPVLQVGSIGFKISDFNWTGDSQSFDSDGIKPVIQGVER